MDCIEIFDNAAVLANKYKEDLQEKEQFQNEFFHFTGFVKRLEKPPKTIVEACKMIYDNELKEVYPYVDIAPEDVLMFSSI